MREHWVIGDVHGCYDELSHLLDKIQYSPTTHALIFVGDLVGRGVAPLQTLKLVKEVADKLVLGNHDINLIVKYLLHRERLGQALPEDLIAVSQSSEGELLINWLRRLPLLCQFNTTVQHKQRTVVVSHAGIPHHWSLPNAQKWGLLCQKFLQNAAVEHLQTIFTADTLCNLHFSNGLDELESANAEAILHAALDGEAMACARIKTAIDYFTRMRLIAPNGDLSYYFEHKAGYQKSEVSKASLSPWYDLRASCRSEADTLFCFGHWAAIEGKSGLENYWAVDTGCVWGGSLTAHRLSDKKIVSVSSGVGRIHFK